MKGRYQKGKEGIPGNKFVVCVNLATMLDRFIALFDSLIEFSLFEINCCFVCLVRDIYYKSLNIITKQDT
jgi:hypothetical protein